MLFSDLLKLAPMISIAFDLIIIRVAAYRRRVAMEADNERSLEFEIPGMRLDPLYATSTKSTDVVIAV
jgi:hypothetical protein